KQSRGLCSGAGSFRNEDIGQRRSCSRQNLQFVALRSSLREEISARGQNDQRCDSDTKHSSLHERVSCEERSCAPAASTLESGEKRGSQDNHYTERGRRKERRKPGRTPGAVRLLRSW